MDFDKVFEAFEETATSLLKGGGKRGSAALRDLQSLITEMRPEVEAATDLAVRSGGQQTHLNTLQAQANVVIARATSNYDTFSATSKRDLRVALVGVLFTAVKLAV